MSETDLLNDDKKVHVEKEKARKEPQLENVRDSNLAFN